MVTPMTLQEATQKLRQAESLVAQMTGELRVSSRSTVSMPIVAAISISTLAGILA